MFHAPTKDEARARIATLVENFERQLPDYHRGSYNETQTRRDFIDPFFQALGWDIDNRSGAAEAYREVIHEDKVRVGQATKAPDYSFRLPGGQRLFFVEAKKPSVKIKDEIMPAYQVRRYGWSAKLGLSLLTDFEELAVYDCTLQPAPTDKAAKARLKYLTFREYDTEFDFVWNTFSKESVLRGGLDKFVAAGSGKRGKDTVDAAFLTTLEAMRAALAQGLATRNRHLTADDLRFLVQMLLDRVIFLRIAEDRGIEPYADLQAVARVKKKDGVYLGLLDRFRTAAARYNSGLFDLEKDTLSAQVRLDNEVLAPLLHGLYYPESPYEFSVIGAEILGSAYERFLGKVITLEPGRVVRIEDKPEVRKAGGVFYTPAYIVNYIVQHTLGPRCAGRTPQQVAQLRVLDPACGSGSFLLGAYQFLLDWHLAYFQQNPTATYDVSPRTAPAQPPKRVENRGRRAAPLTPDGRLSSAVKKAILLNNLYGVDLDAQAVEVTKLSLLLKCLEGETPASIQHALGLERVLPTIDQNIRVGNSLVETDFYDSELDFAPGTEKTVKPFGWHDGFAAVFKQGGFDVVIGNPPYIRIQILRESSPAEADYIGQHYQTARQGNFDIYVAFIEKALALLETNGTAGYILPHKFLNAKYGQATRELLAKGQHVSRVVHFGDQQIFDGISTYTCLLFLTKQPVQQVAVEAVGSLSSWRSQQEPVWEQVPYARLSGNEWNLVGLASAALMTKLRATGLTLADVTDRIFQGLKTSADKIYIVEELARKNGLVKVLCRQDDQEYWLEADLLHPLIKGGDSRRFCLSRTTRLILFPYAKDAQGKQQLIANAELRESFPQTHSYFNKHKAYLTARENGKLGTNWYAYGRTQALDVMPLVKIFTPDIAAKAAFSFDETGDVFFTGGAAGGYGILPAKGLSSNWLLGLLNSRLLEWMVKQTSTQMRGGYFSFESRFIAPLPIPKLNLRKPADRQQYDAVVTLAEQLLAGYAAVRLLTLSTAREQAQARLRHMERRLDGLVYALYGLTAEEIALVEG